MPPVQSGFIAAADVSGYTEFLTGSELDHAHDIMRGLMKVLTRALGHPLQIIKYEGDAILCCAPDATLNNAPLMLDVLEGAYVAFSDHVFNMKACTTCTCKACGNIRGLDLKFFLHHGDFILENSGKGVDLSGPDVILLHRLMKNRVKEKMGTQAYVLATAAAIEHAGKPAGFVPHAEHYEHFGDVACGVADLHVALQRRRDQREERVTRDTAQIVAESIVSAAPSAVWDYYLDPAKRIRWDDTIKSMQKRRNGFGREGVGATMHCSHGSFSSKGITLDWKPFRYFTQQHVPEGAGPLAPTVTVTIETEALADDRTRLTQLVRAPAGEPLSRLILWLGRGSAARNAQLRLARLDEVLRYDTAAAMS
jgi:hypothetical protein